MPAFDPVTAVVRALEILRTVNELERSSVTEIHRHTGIPKPTVLRMIETLMSEGFVAREPGSTVYVPTGRCLALSNGIQAHARLSSIAQPLLSALRRKVVWPCDVAIFDGDAMVFALKDSEFDMLALNRKVGALVPMLLSAIGRAYLAFCSDEKQNSVLARLQESSDPRDAAAQTPKAVSRMLRQTYERGFSLPDRKYIDRVYEGVIWGIGVPIRVRNEVFASMSVMFLRSALSLDEGMKTLVPPLQQAAKEIGAALEKEGLNLSSPRRMQHA